MPDNYYEYEPSLAAAVVFTVLFGLTTLFHIYQMIRTRAWFFTAFIIGGILEVLGFAARSINSSETPNQTFGVFIVQILGLLLAPSLFAASIYMILGRIILLIDGEAFSLVRRTWLTKIFVCGDVLAFLVQTMGGSLMAQRENLNRLRLGRNIVLVGLALQIIFFGLFLITSAVFWFRARRSPTALSREMPWQKHMSALLASSTLILIRCIFRIIEYLQGSDGELMQREIYLYIFDAFLMLVMMCLFHYYHPSEVTGLRIGGTVIVLFRSYVLMGKGAQSDAEVGMLSLNQPRANGYSHAPSL